MQRRRRTPIVKDENHPRLGLDRTDGDGLAKHPIVHIPEVQELTVDFALPAVWESPNLELPKFLLDKFFPWLQVFRRRKGGFIQHFGVAQGEERLRS